MGSEGLQHLSTVRSGLSKQPVVAYLPVFGVNLSSATLSLLLKVSYSVVAACRDPPGPLRGSVIVPWGWAASCAVCSTKARYSRCTVAPEEYCKTYSRPLDCGVAWHSTAQHSTAQHSTAQHSTAQHNTAQHGTAQNSTAWHSTGQHGTTQHSTARHSTAQHSTAQHSRARHDTA